MFYQIKVCSILYRKQRTIPKKGQEIFRWGKDAYVDEYRQRIMELNEQRRDLWEPVRKYENQSFVQDSSS